MNGRGAAPEMRRPSQFFGFTLIELMLTIVVMAILLAIAVPSFNNLSQKYRLKGAAERLSSEMQFARSLSVSRNTSVSVDVKGGADWCLGISANGACDCSADGSCLVDSKERTVNASDFEGVQMDNGDFAVVFGGVRGLPDAPQEFSLSKAGNALNVNLTGLGSVRICSPTGDTNIGGYAECPSEGG